MFELLSGLAMLVVWGILQFVVQPVSGWIHVALIAGVVLVIRGIVGRHPGTTLR
jgi:hypothetical protein